MINSISLNAYSYNTYFSSGVSAAKLAVPVKPSQVIYSQFDHVSGVAAPQGQDGVSVSKLKILNTLIDRLVTARGNDSGTPGPLAGLARHGSGEIDGLIQTYQGRLRHILREGARNPYAVTGRIPEPGALFSITV
jgi:hypothetical protein